jgi:centrosomal protein CEP104
MLAKPRKLRFRVAYCSSEDPEFPARELNAHSPNTQGWLSARMCDYPQEIVVQFDGLVRLSALQILSNE